MSAEVVQEICRLLDQCSEKERIAVLIYLRERLPLHPIEKQWGISSDVILAAIQRSNDLTKRGIRGIIAEAMFEQAVLPTLPEWKSVQIIGDQPFDFLLELADSPLQCRIQVKLQRREGASPKVVSQKLRRELGLSGDFYVVEVQKTRTGSDGDGKATRPYKFGEFDILAVNMHPSSGDWKRFMYTVGAWLLPRLSDPTLIEIMQPVPALADGYWTDDLWTCLNWFTSKTERQLYR